MHAHLATGTHPTWRVLGVVTLGVLGVVALGVLGMVTLGVLGVVSSELVQAYSVILRPDPSQLILGCCVWRCITGINAVLHRS